VAFHHGYTSTDLKVEAYNQLDRWSLRAADRVITVCADFARQIASRGVPPDRISVLHNSINPDYGQKAGSEDRRAIRAAHAISDDERVVLTAGRLSQEKAQADLVMAFARLVRRHPEIKARLVIVGEGPERRGLEAAVAALQVTDRVLLAGAASEVARWYRAADLFALPSLSEGSPNVLLEAMLMELPIVATWVGGVPEIVVHDESALLVGPRNPPAMAEALGRLLTDESLARRLAANAREAALNNHSPESRLHALSAIYGRAVSALTAGAPRLNERWRSGQLIGRETDEIG
jgi:glycosyltransferase involved in cell wall biosynthesis